MVEDKIQVNSISIDLPNTISILANGGKMGGGGGDVLGVKGSAEKTYRTGWVDISPENLGFGEVEAARGGGIMSSAQLSTLKANLCNQIICGGSVFRIQSRTDTVWKYSCGYLDEVTNRQGTQYLIVDINSGAYVYSVVLSEVYDIQLKHLSEELIATIKSWGGGGGEQQIVFATHLEFPSPGELNKLYVAKEEHMAYLWNLGTYSYDVVGTYYVDVETIDGGGAAED